MEPFILIIFVAFLIGMGIFLAKYYRILSSIVNRSNETGIEIFGTRYKNVYSLMADISFLNTLWAKECFMQIKDGQLTELLAKAHNMLRAQVYIGLFMFLVFLVFVAVNTGG
jgi:uncharacterized integral membrane protein